MLIIAMKNGQIQFGRLGFASNDLRKTTNIISKLNDDVSEYFFEVSHIFVASKRSSISHSG